MNITVHTDGASRGNPGASAIAFVINGLPDGKVEYKEAIGTFSNNQAEYRAMLSALEKLLELGIEDADISIFSCSVEMRLRSSICCNRISHTRNLPNLPNGEDKIYFCYRKMDRHCGVLVPTLIRPKRRAHFLPYLHVLVTE